MSQKWWQSKDEKERKAKLEQIMSAPQDIIKKPNPKGDAKFQEEGWADFNVLEKSKNIKLHTYRQSPNPQNPKDVKAVMVIFHGLNSHINNGAHIAQAVAKVGVATVGFDFRGFGKSEGIRGYIESEEQHFSDVIQFISIVEKEYPGKPIFLSGQSLGGLTAFQMHLRFPQKFRGLVMFVPAIKDQSANAPVGKILARIVGTIFPTLETVEQKRGVANRNPQVTEELANDPYIYAGKVIPGTIRTLLNMVDKSYKQYEQFDASFLLIHAGHDKLVCPYMAQELIDRSPSKDKDLLFYENAWHNIWMEEEIIDIIPKMQNWIQKRL